ncbi:MAG: asparagine synthase (glutamine-hydrolyzing) [Peptococcaceae bacterium]
MCGIAGFYQTSFDYTLHPRWLERLEHMKESLQRRGPDQQDTLLYPHAGLAHTRLSIIDLQKGHQPMTRASGSQRCTIVYNGELYNMQELRRQLSGFALSWETDSDTEVILNGYLACGADFFQQLNGIFAFAIYDASADQLILCRDRLGVKPLFYQQTAEQEVLFGSEQKALFAGGITPAIQTDGWCEIWGLGPAHTPGHGVFHNMKEVLPGHYLTITGTQIRDHTYWQLEARPHADCYADTVHTVSALVQDSVKRQMVSDVPICTFLSGGLDSSLVSAICARELARQGQKLQTYSFDFTDNDKNFQANSFQSAQDRPYVDLMVKHLHSQHTYLECSSQKQADYLYKAVDARDLPCMADVESSLLYFCSQVAQQNHVALTGECADEIFGGYPWFHQPAALERHHFPWSYQMEARTALLRDDFLAQVPLEAYAQQAYDATIAAVPRLEGETALEARRREMAYLNVTWFMATLLNRMDRTSMYSGLEARVPYADHRILEYVFNIPWEMKCQGGRTKSLLQETGRSLLPAQILQRKKSPYPKTYDPAYEALLRNRLLEVLAYPNSPILDIVDVKKVRAFLDTPSDYGRPWFGQLMAGPQMIAYLLQINYWMTKYRL